MNFIPKYKSKYNETKKEDKYGFIPLYIEKSKIINTIVSYQTRINKEKVYTKLKK